MKAVPVEIAWNPELSVYASEPFLKAVGDAYGWVGGVDDSGKLRCILPYTIVKKAFVRMIRFRVETIHLGEELDIETEKAFLDSAVDYFRSIGGDIIIPATTNTIFRTFPTGAIAAPYGTFIIDLQLPEETLWSNVHSKHRNVIRNAEKKGVLIRRGVEHAESAYRLVRDTFKRSKLPFMDLESFLKMVQGLGSQVEVFVADHENQVQGCAVIPFSNHSAYYVYGGSVPKPLTGAMNLLQWEAIRHFRGLGVRRYDFCGARVDPAKGSKQAGLVMFKERFGPRFVQGYMWKRPLHPLKASVYSWAVGLLRGGDIVDAERHKLNPT